MYSPFVDRSSSTYIPIRWCVDLNFSSSLGNQLKDSILRAVCPFRSVAWQGLLIVDYAPKDYHCPLG
ncbi:hypothetical protein M758_10G020300 [Ceratodon purpureus]|nr:hypothetical protein M758_10G020300 [Ceratodon purpureus]